MSLSVIRLEAVKEKVGLGRTTIYALQALGDFPHSIPLGPRAVGWRIDELDSWINQRAERRTGLSTDRKPTQ